MPVPHGTDQLLADPAPPGRAALGPARGAQPPLATGEGEQELVLANPALKAPEAVLQEAAAEETPTQRSRTGRRDPDQTSACRVVGDAAIEATSAYLRL